MHKQILRLHLLVFTFINLTGCGNSSSREDLLRFVQESQQQTSQDTPQEETPEVVPPPSEMPALKPSICSDLTFKNVKWPSSLTEFQVNTFALAMNISGSFEGHTGWTNLTNNFDGQGISLGLFNQNLGQGSLQPLMIELRRAHLATMKTFFSTNQYKLVDSMLTKWGGVSNSPLSKVQDVNPSYRNDFSDLDDPDAIAEESETDDGWSEKASTPKNQVSVDWAVKNVFKGSQFKPEWKSALQKMAGSAEYVTIQVLAAKAIHDKAMSYMKKYGFKEMRAYFFFFDIVVQNGGISKSIENKYFSWAKSNKSASEKTKLKKLLEYRLTIVIPKYRNDVKSRKLAVIDGVGTVHGDRRDFAQEYCSPQWTTQFPKNSLP